MRRALRRAAQVFVAAGVLGLVSPALAQSSRPVGKSVPAVASSRTVESAKAHLPGGAVGQDEVQVELAWLANKATFHHALGAHVVGGSMEVRGYVPNMAIEELAIRLAQEHTKLAVVDRLQVNPNVLIPIGGGEVDEMTQKASELLAEDLGDQATGLEVTAKDNGIVTIKGAVLSIEDKLTVSRKMRQVSGCCVVVNLVNVTSVYRAGHTVADGTLPTTSKKSAPQPYSTGAVATTPSTPLVIAKPTGGESVKVPVQPEKKPAPPAGWSEKPANADAPKEVAMPKTVVSEKPPSPHLPWAAESAKTNKPDGSKWPEAFEEKTAKAAYATSGTVVFDDELAPTAPPLKPTPGTDTLAPLPTAAASKLKKQIETVCGKQARDVQVEVKADKMLHVTVKVADPKTQVALTDKILQLPEMATPNVRLEMQVSDKK